MFEAVALAEWQAGSGGQYCIALRQGAPSRRADTVKWMTDSLFLSSFAYLLRLNAAEAVKPSFFKF